MNFSKFADKLNVTVRGGSGQGGSSGWNSYHNTNGTINTRFTLSISKHGSNGISSTYGGRFWECAHGGSFRYNTMQVNGTFSETRQITARNSGGNGAVGNVNNGNDIDISNQNFKLTFPTVYSKNINIYRTAGSLSSHALISSGSYHTTATMVLKGSSGATGGTTSAFGITASGGRGGGGGGTDANFKGPSYGSGSLSGGGGTLAIAFTSSVVTIVDSSNATGSVSTGLNFQCGNSCPGQVVISNFRYK